MREPPKNMYLSILSFFKKIHISYYNPDFKDGFSNQKIKAPEILFSPGPLLLPNSGSAPVATTYST
jgi:hypothetical protein